VKFHLTRHWLKLENQLLKVTPQCLWLDYDSTRPSHDSLWLDSKNLRCLWLEGLVTLILTWQKWLQQITIQEFIWAFQRTSPPPRCACVAVCYGAPFVKIFYRTDLA